MFRPIPAMLGCLGDGDCCRKCSQVAGTLSIWQACRVKIWTTLPRQYVYVCMWNPFEMSYPAKRPERHKLAQPTHTGILLRCHISWDAHTIEMKATSKQFVGQILHILYITPIRSWHNHSWGLTQWLREKTHTQQTPAFRPKQFVSYIHCIVQTLLSLRSMTEASAHNGKGGGSSRLPQHIVPHNTLQYGQHFHFTSKLYTRVPSKVMYLWYIIIVSQYT